MLHKENCFIAEIEGIFDRKILEEANNIIFVCSSLSIGNDRQLGKVLLETYIYTLSELEFLPKSIILFNEAVLLTLPISDCCLYLKRLQDRGVEILVCDTSANYYDIIKKRIFLTGLLWEMGNHYAKAKEYAVLRNIRATISRSYR